MILDFGCSFDCKDPLCTPSNIGSCASSYLELSIDGHIVTIHLVERVQHMIEVLPPTNMYDTEE